MEAQVFGEIVKGKTLLIQSALFLEVLITLQKNISKGSDRKRNKLVRMVLRNIDKKNRKLKKIICGSENHLIAKCPKPHV